MDGPGRVTRRNRKFLRVIDPVCSDGRKIPRTTLPPAHPTESIEPVNDRMEMATTGVPATYSAKVPQTAPQVEVFKDAPRVEVPENAPQIEVPQDIHQNEASNQQSDEVRRSNRSRIPRQRFQANLRGKGHTWTQS